ncbi:hypothetical protein [uncultured Clostridium sp.]|uniref:hypothetical protein n=1 Tax=uncultured Clostridium sp. TaxID=59620 RepID=UPI00258CD0C2|nr:hypothetical protein [uncultured Clostridium sp.]
MIKSSLWKLGLVFFVLIFAVCTSLDAKIMSIITVVILILIIAVKFWRKEFLILGLIILNERIFYLIGRPLNFIISIISILLFIFGIKKIINKKYIFKFEIISLIIICFFSEIGAYFMWGQSLLDGFCGMYYIFIYLLYFYLVDFFDKDVQRIDNIKNIIFNVGSIISILYLFQALIYPKIIIFNMSYSFRDGRVRFFSGYVFIMFSILIGVTIILKKFEVKKLIFISIQIFSLIYVSQTRNFIIGIFILIVWCLFINRKIPKYKIIYITLIIVFLYYFIFSNDHNIINNFINSIMKQFDNKSGTIGTRFLEFRYYINLLSKNWLSGIGILYSRFRLTPIITGYIPYFYFIGDLGLIGVVIQTGILGLFWMIYFFAKIYLFGVKIKSKCIEASYLFRLLVIFLIGLFASGLIFDNNAILYICIVLAMAESKYKSNLIKS